MATDMLDSYQRGMAFKLVENLDEEHHWSISNNLLPSVSYIGPYDVFLARVNLRKHCLILMRKITFAGPDSLHMWDIRHTKVQKFDSKSPVATFLKSGNKVPTVASTLLWICMLCLYKNNAIVERNAANLGLLTCWATCLAQSLAIGRDYHTVPKPRSS